MNHQHTWIYAGAQGPLEAMRYKGRDIPATLGRGLFTCTGCGAMVAVHEGETVEQAAIRMNLSPRTTNPPTRP